jgi:hypothetical protein
VQHQSSQAFDTSSPEGDELPGSRLLRSELSSIFSEETLDIFRDINDLANQFEVISQIVTDYGQLDDLEYRCVAVQYRLLSYDYKSLTSVESLDRGWDSIIEGLCRITAITFFGTPLL